VYSGLSNGSLEHQEGFMQGRDIIVIGASAGGVQALTEVMRGLPEDLAACVFVVVHTSPTSPGILPVILDRAGPLVVKHAEQDERPTNGHVYVAPPNSHMLLMDGRIMLTQGPKENGFRPAVDPLFRTAARAFGDRVVGVVLSGGLDDGTQGLNFIKRHGGISIVQDPDEAPFPSMPANAVNNDHPDHVVPIAQIAPLLAQLAAEPYKHRGRTMSRKGGNGDEMDVAEVGDASLRNEDLPGPPSPFTCPECGGALWELDNGQIVRYRCHVGHSYSIQGLTQQQSQLVEDAMWTALRALEEAAAMRRRIAARSSMGKLSSMAKEYDRQAADYENRASVLREVLLSGKMRTAADTPVPPAVNQRKKRGSGTTRVAEEEVETITPREAKQASLKSKRK
jgi:two-component system chemotaxis response regulator CheB